MDVAPVYQTVSYAMWDEWDTIDNDSLTEAAMRMIRIWTTSTNEWYRQMTRICLIQTLGPLRILIGTCRRRGLC